MDSHASKPGLHTNTSLSDWTRCKYLWKKLHQDIIDVYGNPIHHKDGFALTLGNVLHQCLEALYKKQSIEPILQPHMEMMNEDSDMTMKIRAMLEGRRICKQLLHLYDGMKWYEKELELEVEIAGERYAGKIDGIVEYNGKLWVLDHKSYGRERVNRYINYHYSPQLIMYMFMARQHGHDEVCGYIVDNWRVPSIKQSSDETQKNYINKMIKHIVDVTRKQVDGELKGAPYFTLDCYPVSDEVLERVYTSVVSKIVETKVEGTYNRDYTSCVDSYGQCKLWKLCHDEVDEKQLRERDTQHPELLLIK